MLGDSVASPKAAPPPAFAAGGREAEPELHGKRPEACAGRGEVYSLGIGALPFPVVRRGCVAPQHPFCFELFWKWNERGKPRGFFIVREKNNRGTGKKMGLVVL